MTDRTDTSHGEHGQVTSAAAEIYESFFVPALFGQFTGPVLDRAGVGDGSRVLDVGCGTGVLARAAARRTGRRGSVAAVDPNDGMLAVARRVEPSVAWRPGVAESLPFADRTFDRIVSQFAAMFFTDRPAALAEMSRVCVPGGTVTVGTWASLDRTPGYAAMVTVVERELGDVPADELRAPFVLGRPGDLRPLLADVGDDACVDEVGGVARFDSIEDWVRTDVRGWTLSELVDDDAEAALIERARRELAPFVDGDGSVEFAVPALIGTVTVG